MRNTIIIITQNGRHTRLQSWEIKLTGDVQFFNKRCQFLGESGRSYFLLSAGLGQTFQVGVLHSALWVTETSSFPTIKSFARL